MAEDLSPIVVGVDGSDPARVAMRWAAAEAVRRGRPLRLVHAVRPLACDVPFSAQRGAARLCQPRADPPCPCPVAVVHADSAGEIHLDSGGEAA